MASPVSPISRQPSISASPPPQPHNPLSLRLYKVLATNFDDDSTKEALNTLAELYAPAAPSNDHQTINGKGKGKAVNGELDEEGDSASDEEAVSGVKTRKHGVSTGESVPGEIAAKARRNLKRDVQIKLAESSRMFLNAFAEVDKQLDALQGHIASMRTRCDEAQNQLTKTNESCKSLLDRAGSLREQRQEVTTKHSIVSLFLNRFTLTSEEAEAITSRDVPVSKRFFSAMSKAERIREDCRVLMAGEEGPTQAGLDIMSATSSYLEQAYEKIFRWCSFEFRQMGRDAHLDVDPVMREAVRRLQQRPELLNEALTYLSQTRQSTLLSSFTDALTRGGPNGLPRPIELHAHDPLRYAGDMLAWVHQTIAAEREFLEGLFGVRGDGRMVGSVRTFTNSVEEEWMSELMDAAVGKLCTPLKVRIQQTVRSQESSITLYKLLNLLHFYSLTMQRTIGADAALSKTLLEMTEMSYHFFSEAIGAQGRTLLRTPLDPNDRELSPPFSILDHVQILREIITVYQSSVAEDDTLESQISGFSEILDKMVDPAIEMTLLASEEKHRVRPSWDRAIFILNTLTYLQNALEPYPFTVEKRDILQGLLEARIMELIEDHYNTIIMDTGLGEIIEAWKAREGNEPLSRLPTSSPARLQNVLHKFSLWLGGHTIDHSPRLAQLTVQSLSTHIHQKALERLVKTYKWFCEEVKRPENRYEAAATLLGSERPFGQVHLLYQIFGIEEVESESEGEDEGGDEDDEDQDNEDQGEDGEEEEDEEGSDLR
ncbi:oligomeric complex COG6 [Cristinia sonorae]|uniref:Conserved oligomeric Golgi complex subunit 6 n=1 Tax=Cristinia sonorae TaxID=1940300 RepID=A0A8K0UYS7_9AGAR|nr:oligomeric complex COG6 [Cristinia sonorae]